MTMLRDSRLRAFLAQAMLVLFFLGLGLWLASNTMRNLEARGITVGFDFLGRPARFPISESWIAFTPTDSFGRAYLAGLLNTLFLSLLVTMLACLLGMGIALMRRSLHPLTRALGTVYVETMRNTPLVVQLLFWYALVTTALPPPRNALNPLPGTFLSVRGLVFPSFVQEGSLAPLALSLLASVLGILILMAMARRQRGEPHPLLMPAVWILCLMPPLVWWLSGLRFVADPPVLRGFNFVGGIPLTPEFVAVLTGLVLYTAAFIGEIIRGGIDAIGKGQVEAGRSMGLTEGRILRLIVLPQALRIIIPPMTSQFLNIVKNTTLALVVGYPDLSFVVATTINQTGQVLEGIAILVVVFLTISIAISLLMNWYNRRVALVQR